MVRGQKSFPAQTALLVDYMANHLQFAVGRLLGQLGRKTARMTWELLAADLNKIGPEKTVQQWMKTWNDLKSRTRAKAAKIKTNLKKTGNNTTIEKLSDVEKKILIIVGPSAALGNPDLQESMPEPVTVVLNQETMEFQFETIDHSNQPETEKGNEESVAESNEESVAESNEESVAEANEESVAEANEEGVAEENEESIPEESVAEVNESFAGDDESIGEDNESAANVNGPTRADVRGTHRVNVSAVGTSAETKRSWHKEDRNPQDYFGRVRAAREKREAVLRDTANKFLDVQTQHNETQAVMARTANDNENQRFELERARILQNEAMAASILAMSVAVTELAKAIRERR